MMTFHSSIFIYSFRKYSLSICFAFTGNQADRGLSLTYSAISKDHAGLRFPRPFLGGGKGGALLEPRPQELLHGHRGLCSGHTGFPRRHPRGGGSARRRRVDTQPVCLSWKMSPSCLQALGSGGGPGARWEVGSEESKAQRNSKRPRWDEMGWPKT